MAFGCFTSSPRNKTDEYVVPLHSTTSTPLSADQTVEVNENQKKKKKHFWTLGGKKDKKTSALKVTIEQHIKTIEDLTEAKVTYEAEIARLQSQLKEKDAAIKNTTAELELEKDKNQKLRAAKAEMLRHREEEKKMICENMTLIEKIFAPPENQEASDLSSEIDVEKKKAKKKNSLRRKKNRDQKNEIHIAAEYEEDV